MELKRIVSTHNIIILLLVFVINICMFMYVNKGELSNYHKMDTSMKKERQRAQEEYNSTYQADIQSIVNKAEHLKSNKLFSDKNGFAYNNIIKTQKDYEKCLDISLTTADTTAIAVVMDYRVVWVLALVVIVYIVNQLHMDRDNGMWLVTYAAARGRCWLAAVRVGIVMIVTLVVSICLYGSIVIISVIGFNGIEGLKAPLQNLSPYRLSTIECNMVEFVLLNFVWSYVAILAMVMVIYMLMSLWRNRKNVVVASVALGIAEYLLYVNIEPHSRFGLLRSLNIVRLFFISDICTQYHNIGFSTYVVSKAKLILFTLILVICICSIVAVVSGMLLKPQTRASRFGWISDKVVCGYQVILSHSPYVIKEMHKCIFTSNGKWAIVVLMLAVMYFTYSDLKYFSDMENYNDKLYLEYGGIDYSEIETLINERKAEYEMVQEKVTKLKAEYEAGKTDLITYLGYSQYFTTLTESMDGMKEIDGKIIYLTELKEQFDIDGYLMSDRGYEQMFGIESIARTVFINMALCVCVTILSYGNVHNEFKSNMIVLISSSERGRRKVYIRKMLACSIVSAISSLAVYMVEIAILIEHYGLPYVNAPVQSLTFMESCGLNVSILQWLVILIVGKVFLASMIAALLHVILYGVKSCG